jgi:plastocyanin
MRIPHLLGMKATLGAALCLMNTVNAATITVTVVDKDGKLATNAVVSAYSTAQPAVKPELSQGISITQEKLQFVPLVTLLNVGSSAKFVNRDTFDHHIKTFAGAKSFELRIDAAKRKGNAIVATEALEPVVFNEPGAVAMGCHIHGSMRGFVFVADTPWSGKTDEKGTVVLNDVPDGEVELRAWHPDQFLNQTPTKIKASGASAIAALQLNVAVRVRRSLSSGSMKDY